MLAVGPCWRWQMHAQGLFRRREAAMRQLAESVLQRYELIIIQLSISHP